MTNEQLTKALSYAAQSIFIKTVGAGTIHDDIDDYDIGDEVFVYVGYEPGAVLGRTSDCPELAEWLKR